MGGPDVWSMTDLARSYRRARGWRRPVIVAPLPGKAAAAFRAGFNLCPDHSDGSVKWEQWLANRYG